MGYLVDRLAVALEHLRRLQTKLVRKGNAAGAADLGRRVISPLEGILLEVDGSPFDARSEIVATAYEAQAAKVRFPKSRGNKGLRKKGRQRPGRLIWTCCHEARRTVGRRGKPLWVADCQWKKKDQTGQTVRLVGKGSQRPKVITIKGRKMKKCQVQRR